MRNNIEGESCLDLGRVLVLNDPPARKYIAEVVQKALQDGLLGEDEARGITGTADMGASGAGADQQPEEQHLDEYGDVIDDEHTEYSEGDMPDDDSWDDGDQGDVQQGQGQGRGQGQGVYYDEDQGRAVQVDPKFDPD